MQTAHIGGILMGMIYLGLPVVARILGISPRRARELADEGRIVGARRIGSRLRPTWEIPCDSRGRPDIRDWPLPRGRRRRAAVPRP